MHIYVLDCIELGVFVPSPSLSFFIDFSSPPVKVLFPIFSISQII